MGWHVYRGRPEVQLGTNPVNPDADGDGIPDWAEVNVLCGFHLHAVLVFAWKVPVDHLVAG